jgi:hypothetical protein
VGESSRSPIVFFPSTTTFLVPKSNSSDSLGSIEMVSLKLTSREMLELTPPLIVDLKVPLLPYPVNQHDLIYLIPQ